MGFVVGIWVGSVGSLLGCKDGITLGVIILLGASVVSCLIVGIILGINDGSILGLIVLGLFVGTKLGSVGLNVGEHVGLLSLL